MIFISILHQMTCDVMITQCIFYWRIYFNSYISTGNFTMVLRKFTMLLLSSLGGFCRYTWKMKNGMMIYVYLEGYKEIQGKMS